MFWGGAGYEALWNEAPFNNNQDLYVLKDDYTKVFGKHFVKAGLNVSWNKKNEDTDGNGSSQHSRFWGAAGLPANSFANTGNVLADFLLRDMSWGFSEGLGGPLGSAALERPRVLRCRFVAGVAAHHARLRVPLLHLLQLPHAPMTG